MSLSVSVQRDAILHPDYHRHLMFGEVDRKLCLRLGRALAYHETQGRLPTPQYVVMTRIERAVARRAGEMIVVLMARQTGKNEINAHLEARMLSIFGHIPGSVWVRTAPTYRPQIVNSKLRLEKMLRADPLLAGRWRHREGYIVEHGCAQIQFLSADTSANVIGATASIALSVDEAHKIDAGKFEEEFGPFTASTNAPTILWGVAADGLDLLNEYREKARGTDRLLEYPAEVWCELSSAYAAHYAGRVRELGADHPVILTQYRLIPVESIGAYLSKAQRESLTSGDHPRLEGPRPGPHAYYLVADLGGASELDADERFVRSEEPERDSTFALVLEHDLSVPADPHPLLRVASGLWETGRDHMQVIPDLIAMCRHWQVQGGAIDARGVGEATAEAVHAAYPAVKPYKATAESVSEDCYDLIARLNRGTVKLWRADPAEDPTLRELHAQARHTRYEISGQHTQMRLAKPTGVKSAGLHIDGIKALTYIRRAMTDVSPLHAEIALDLYALRMQREREERIAGERRQRRA